MNQPYGLALAMGAKKRRSLPSPADVGQVGIPDRPSDVGLAARPRPAVAASPYEQASSLAQSLLAPVLDRIDAGASRRLSAGADAIRGASSSLAQAFARHDFGAPYAAAIPEQAAVDAALHQAVSGAGGDAASALAARLRAGGVDQAAADAAAGQVSQDAAGSANAALGLGSAELGRLVAGKAAAGDYGQRLPGIADLAGLQNLRALAGQVSADTADQQSQVLGQLPALEQSIASELRQRQDAEAAAAADARKINPTLSADMGVAVNDYGEPVLDAKGRPTPYKKAGGSSGTIFGSSTSGYYRYDPDTQTLTKLTAGTGPAAEKPQIIHSGSDVYSYSDGVLTPLVTGSKSAAPKLTAGELQNLKEVAGQTAADAWRGRKDPKTGAYTVPPQTYQKALRDMLAHGIPLQIAQAALNAYWTKPGYEADVQARMEGRVVWDRATGGRGRPVRSFQERNPGKAGAVAEPAAYTGQFVAPRSGVNLARVDPRLLAAVDSLGRFLGKKITVESGRRDDGQQAALYARYVQSGYDPRYIAAKPGTSNHERGEALDLTIDGVPIARAVPADVLARFGLHTPVKGDLPHTTLLGVSG